MSRKSSSTPHWRVSVLFLPVASARRSAGPSLWMPLLQCQFQPPRGASELSSSLPQSRPLSGLLVFCLLLQVKVLSSAEKHRRRWNCFRMCMFADSRSDSLAFSSFHVFCSAPASCSSSATSGMLWRRLGERIERCRTTSRCRSQLQLSWSSIRFWRL